MKKIMHSRVFDSHGCRDSVPENEEVVGNSIVCSFHRLSIFGRSVNNFILLLGLFLFSNVSIAQTITVDGNPEDWDAENFAFFSVKSYVLDAFGTGQVDNQFTSSKDFFFADGTTNEHLTWVIGQTKAKNDIANAAAVLNNGILYFAGDRTSNNGDAQIGFWFFLNGTAPRVLQTSPNTGGDFAPAHAVGDILILADFTGGGSNATVSIYQWVGTGGNVPNTNGRLNSTNLTGTVAINNNSAYDIPVGWTFINPTYDTNEFYEGQVDLSSLNLDETCFSSFLLEARASQSVTASLDDFAGGNFNVRPVVSINDVTVCSGQPAQFTATVDGGIQPILFSFNGGPFTANNVFTIDPATSSTTVTVIAQGAGPNFCESDPATGNLTVIQTPEANAGPDKVLTCTTTSIALSGSSTMVGATFSWVASNGGNIVSGADTATPTVNAAGTYTLTVTSPTGNCSDTDVAVVTLNNTPPNADAGADKVLTCTTTSIALSGSSSTPGATFAWVASNGGNIVSGANTATPTVNAAGTYTLTVTNPANGCTATDVALVTLNNTPPNANAGADKVLTCTTTSIALSGSSSTPGATFAWVASNGGNIVSGANTATPTVNAAGTYTLTVTNPANGCTATDVALVTLNNTPPNVNAGADKELTCTTTSIALSGSSSTPGATFAWVASNGGNIVSGANTATPTVNAAGTYTLTVTNPANGCTATDVALVTFNGTPPNANAGADKVLTCVVTSIALSGSSSTPGATFAWVASNGGNIVSGANTATPTVNAAGTYTLTVTNPANGCTATDVALVTLNNTPPNVNAGADKVLTCIVTSIALSGSSSTPGATFAWVASNGGNIVSGANTATPTVNAAGTYTLTVTNPANGCTATDVALVTLNNTPPNANAGADKVLTCVVTSIALSGSSSTPGATFAWVASNGGNIVSGANTATPTVNAAGTYTLTVTNPANGCTATDVALVTLNNTPPNANAGADKVLTCTTTSIALSGSSSTPGATFAWVASNGGNIVSGANTATPTVNAAGTYTLTVTNPTNGCTATDVALVTLNNTPPNANAGPDKELTCVVTSIALSGSSSTPGATFAWVASNGGNIVSGADTATPTVNAVGTYTLTVTNPANGCTATDVALVTLNNTPPDAAAGDDASIECGSSSTSLSGSSSTPGATFAWVASNGGNIISGADTATPTVSAGTYTLTVTNPANGCTASDAVDVTTQSCRTFCTYTQGYYGNSGGIACTPDGQSTTYDLIYNSLLNMPGEYMYLGRGIGAADPGGSFTATPADVAKIIEIMPGGGAAGSIAGDYTPYTVQPLQNGKIRNVLLSQTIALALNLYMPADLSESVGNFSLEGSGGKYLVTAPRAEGSSCEEPVQADCLLQQNAIQSSTLPIPASVIAALPPNPKVWDLFQLAKNALGGLLPAGVTHANISKTVDIINVGFDKCRFFIEFADTAQACPVPEPIIAKVGFNDVVDVEIYPVPFKDNLTMTYRFDSDAPVTIEVYDIRGVLLSTQTDTDVHPNKQIAIPVNFTKQQAQMYFVKITSDKGTITKKVISE